MLSETACEAPDCYQVIPQARLERYPDCKTCSPTCSKNHRKAYKTSWVGFYLLKKAQLDGDPRWRNVREYERSGDYIGAAILRNKIEMEARKADQARRHASDGDIKIYRAMHPKPPRG